MSFILYGSILLTILVAQTTSAEASFVFECHENSKGKFTHNSTYKTNLNLALSNLSQTSSLELKANRGFYKFSQGQSPDKVNAVGLCRGDVEPEICHKCLNKTSHHLNEFCPNEREAIGGFDECVLHYSNRSLTGPLETYPRAYTWTNQSASTNYTDGFSRSLGILFNDLISQASKGGPLGKYSSEQIKIGLGFDTIYAVAQCTPDLSKIDCEKCLDEASVDVRRFEGVLGCRVITPRCNFRFEVYLFFGLAYSPPPPLPLIDTTYFQETKKSNALGAGGLAVSAAAVILIISVGVYTRMKKANIKAETAEEIGLVGNLKFDFRTIKVATNNFSVQKQIEQSTLGVVYKGTLQKGQDIAVRCVDSKLHLMYIRNEIVWGSKLFHRNLVRIIGFCSKGDTTYLVYEFLPWKLDHILLDQPLYRSTNLDWDIRFKIINGIARALLYLHEDSGLKLAHGNIRSSGILLDKELNPKISCFGNDYIRIPFIEMDVFRFGELILEIITRQTSKHHAEYLISWVRRNWRREETMNIIDPELRESNDIESIIRCIHIALLCVQEAASRPTINSIVLMLNSNSVILPDLPESEESFSSQSENSSSVPILSESLSSSNSFVSAQENLSPISEINSHENESGPFGRVVARVRQLSFRGIVSLWLGFVNNSDTHCITMNPRSVTINL